MMGAQDMFLLRHFITHASIDLVIRQDVLVNDALPLAFQVRKTPPLAYSGTKVTPSTY